MFFNISKLDLDMSVFNITNWTMPDIPDQWSELCEKTLGLLNFYYLPTVILVGLVGNMLSCVVFLNTHLKLRSSSYYLAALSTADFGFLISILFVWLNNTFGIRVYNIDGWCQALVYLSSVCSFLSVWLIVSFTVERFIAVQYPLHRPRMCTIHRAKTVIAVLAAISVLFHTYSFLTVGIEIDKYEQASCAMRDGYSEAMRVINIIDLLLTLIVPLVLIVVMNTLITKNLLKFSQRLGRSGSITHDSRNHISMRCLRKSSGNPGTAQNSGGSQTQEINSPAARRLGFIPRALSTSSARNLVTTRTQRNITKMLLLISTVFILLNLPSYIMRLYSLWHQKTQPRSLWCSQQLFMLLFYTNFSINFLLYSMYGITFRRCLWQLMNNKFRTMVNSVCSDLY